MSPANKAPETLNPSTSSSLGSQEGVVVFLAKIVALFLAVQALTAGWIAIEGSRMLVYFLFKLSILGLLHGLVVMIMLARRFQTTFTLFVV
jgi:hypothetical protein